MSREDLVFTKKAIVVVAVLSVLGTVALGGGAAAMWISSMREDITSTATAAATAAAVAAAREAITPVRTDVVGHVREDDTRVADLQRRVDRLESWRDQVGLPAERRRRLTVSSP